MLKQIVLLLGLLVTLACAQDINDQKMINPPECGLLSTLPETLARRRESRESRGNGRSNSDAPTSVAALPVKWKWQVSFIHVRDNSPAQFVCAGSLLNSIWVMTTARCIYNYYLSRLADGSYPGVRVRLGSNSWLSDGSVRTVAKMIVYPRFEWMDPSNSDLALVKLSKPITYNNTTRPVCLPSTSDTLCMYVNREALTTGWGTLNVNNSKSNDGDDLSVNVTEARLTVHADWECRKAYANRYYPDSMLCAAGASGNETCQGDLGGPLVMDDGSGTFYQIGIASSDQDCVANNLAIFTRLYKFTDWIKRTISSN